MIMESEETIAFDVEVRYKQRHRVHTIDFYDTILTLKIKILQDYDMYDDRKYNLFQLVIVKESSSSSEEFVTKRLIDNEIAFEILFREQESSLGRIEIILIDLFDDRPNPTTVVIKNDKKVTMLDTSADDSEPASPWPYGVYGCVEKISNPSVVTQYEATYSNSTGNLLDRLLNIISSTCLKQGTLQRRCATSNAADQWKDLYFMLTVNKLWSYNITKGSENDRKLSFISLDSSSSVNVFEGSLDKLIIESETLFAPVILRTRGNERDLYNWIEAINNRMLSRDENDSILASEMLISDYQLKLSEHECANLSKFTNLRVILANSHLRGILKEYLRERKCEDVLQFWEVTEDFYINHRKMSAEGVRIRALAILEKFLRPTSPLSVELAACLKGKDKDVVVDTSNPNIFRSLQQEASDILTIICEDLFLTQESSPNARSGKRFLQLAFMAEGAVTFLDITSIFSPHNEYDRRLRLRCHALSCRSKRFRQHRLQSHRRKISMVEIPKSFIERVSSKVSSSM